MRWLDTAFFTMSNKEQIRAHVIVEGRVQGVCYRMFAAEQGRLLGLAGWVRNLHDGNVELLAEGEAARVHELVEWCRHGPPHAGVTRLAESYDEFSGNLEGFEIRR